MNNNYVVGLGEILWDVLPSGKKLGGAPTNFAFHAGQFGLNAVAVSALGEDELADETIRQLDKKRISFVMPRVEYPTGTVQVELDTNGVPTYEIMRNVAWDNIPFTDEMRQVAGESIAVCWGTLAQRNAMSRNTIHEFLNAVPKDCLRIFDVNLRQDFYTKEVVCESMKHCNILKINDEELDVIGAMLGIPTSLGVEARCRRILMENKLDILILTCGTNCSYVFSAATTSCLQTPKVEAIDTVGAGDSFTGAFCAALLKGKTIGEAHRIAVEVSAYVCTQNGAMPELSLELHNHLSALKPCNHV